MGAYAGARLGSAVLRGLAGDQAIECAYVKSDIVPNLAYFTQKVVFGKAGVEKVLPIGKLNEHEQTRLEEAKTALKIEIETGMKFSDRGYEVRRGQRIGII